jgi:outer membrane protein assembly factor BamB
MLVGIVSLALIIMSVMVMGAAPTPTSGALNYTAADQLLADSPWPTIGRNYKHQGWSPYAGPTNPQTRGLAPINKADGADPAKEYGTYLRSAYMGEGGMLLASGGMTGFFEVRWQGGALVRTDEFYTCCGGETWVEDVTIGRHNAVYVANEGGFIRKVVKVGSGATARWSDQPTDCHPQAGCGWKRFHGFLHSSPALYPTALAPSQVAVLIISPDGYIVALDSADGAEIWRFRYTTGTGNKESVREKGFTWDAQGRIFFAWGGHLFIVNPDGTEFGRIPLGVSGVTSGPVLADDGRLYITGTGFFLQINPANGEVRRFNMGSSPLDSTFYPRTAKERWPALSPNSSNPATYTVYFTASNGVLYAMDPLTWQPRWVFRYDGPAGDFDGIKSDPLVDINGRIYFYGADQHLYQINPNGTRGWPGLNGKVGVSTATDRFYPGTQLVMDADGTIYAASTGSGRNVVWAVGTGSAVPPTPTPTATSNVPPTATPTRTPTPVPGTGPTVTILTPADGTVLPPWAGFQINASATGSGGIASIRIFGNGQLLKTCTNTTSCSHWWNPNTGTHTIQVQATNNAAQTGSATVTVTRP